MVKVSTLDNQVVLEGGLPVQDLTTPGEPLTSTDNQCFGRALGQVFRALIGQ